MIRITGFIHREPLRDLIGRWMLDRVDPADQLELMRLVLFNSVYVARYLPALTQAVLAGLHRCPLSSRPSRTKGDIKDQLVAHVPAALGCASERVRRLIAAYRADPGLYYRETPFRGTLYFREQHCDPLYVGSCRIKRIRRLAEKSARRVVGWLYAEIARHPEVSESDRDVAVRPCRDAPGACLTALEQREYALLRALRDAGSAGLAGAIEINDVAGMKILIPPSDERRVLTLLDGLGCGVAEREVHAGDYNAVNLLVDHLPDRARILAEPLPGKVVRLFQAHGVQPAEVARWFEAFVRDGEPQVRVEIICSDYAETLEGEIGRCMHEDRIIRQRQHPHHQGQLAQNVEFLLELVFTMPAAPRVHLDRLPVRLWDRYLPESFDEVKRVLFGLPSVELNLD
jgi:hypothetical protein